jgi:hypothetical protein
MAGADELGEGFAGHGDELLLEGGALVAKKDGIASAGLAVTLAQGGGDVGDLVAAWFALANRAAELLEGRQEIGLDEVGL